MRKIIVNGRLGNTPEVKTTKNGNSYTTFRFASTEFNEKETTWFNVTVWDPSLQNFCSKLNVGSSVIIDGDYTDNIYFSKQTNQPAIGREIRLSSIHYGIGGSKNETGTQDNAGTQTATYTTPTAAAPAPVQTTVAPQPAAPAQMQAPTSYGNDDELPF